MTPRRRSYPFGHAVDPVTLRHCATRSCSACVPAAPPWLGVQRSASHPASRRSSGVTPPPRDRFDLSWPAGGALQRPDSVRVPRSAHRNDGVRGTRTGDRWRLCRRELMHPRVEARWMSMRADRRLRALGMPSGTRPGASNLRTILTPCLDRVRCVRAGGVPRRRLSTIAKMRHG